MSNKGSDSQNVRGSLDRRSVRLNANYKRIVDDLRAFLDRVRSEMDEEEMAGKDRETLFKTFGPLLFKKINDSMAGIEKAARGLTEEGHRTHREYLQKVIHPVALQSPFNRRSFEKPRGYPGDYLTLEMIYADPCRGDSAFAQLMNFHSQTLPIAEAVRERCLNVKVMMLETIRANPEASFLSVGAGSAREVREILETGPGCEASFYLLDQDREALDFAKDKLKDNLEQVHFIHMPTIKLLREDLGMRFDFVYSMGLVDYLSDIFARRLIKRLYGLLKERGLLVISNASHNPQRTWMEHGSEWYLFYRDRETLLGLADGLNPAPSGVSVREFEGIGSMFPFLVIEK